MESRQAGSGGPAPQDAKATQGATPSAISDPSVQMGVPPSRAGKVPPSVPPQPSASPGSRTAKPDEAAVFSGVSAVGTHQFELVVNSITALSKDVRDAIRRLPATAAAGESVSPIPAQPKAAAVRFFVPVALLLMLILVLIVGLWIVIGQSHRDFDRGIEIATLGYSQGQNASAMTRRIFLLASGHQIVTFKAAAFVISALMFFVGAVFVLYKAEASYDLRTESSALKASLSTSSPGLVIVTLSAALAIATLHEKSNVADHTDFDLLSPGASATVPPPPTATTTTPRVDRAAEDELRQQIQQTLKTLNPPSRKP